MRPPRRLDSDCPKVASETARTPRKRRSAKCVLACMIWLTLAVFVALPATAGTIGTVPAHSSNQDPFGNPAGCKLFVDDAHLATSVRNSVKVNAHIECAVGVDTLTLVVILYKKHFLGSAAEVQAVNVTENNGQAVLQNQGTFVSCKNRKLTTWYGQAVAEAKEAGQLYYQIRVSPHTVTLDCGT